MFDTGEAHIQNFDHAFVIQHQVGRFDISMHNARPMCRFQPVARLPDVVNGRLDFDRPLLLHPLSQIDTWHIFHDQERLLSGVVSIEGFDDIGMLQFGRRSHFPLKAIHGPLIFQPRRRKDFDGHDAAHHLVLGLEDSPHAPFAQLFQQHIVSQFCLRLVDASRISILALQNLPQPHLLLGRLEQQAPHLRQKPAELPRQVRVRPRAKLPDMPQPHFPCVVDDLFIRLPFLNPLRPIKRQPVQPLNAQKSQTRRSQSPLLHHRLLPNSYHAINLPNFRNTLSPNSV